MSLQVLMKNGLPLNRKERFYTATVFPMLVCRDGFRYFDLFTSLITGYVSQPIDPHPSTTNIQFFTEYGFAESNFGQVTERFQNSPIKRDTPDIIILIRGSQTTMIAVEAKMFLAPSPKKLHRQMTDQKLLLDYLKSVLAVDIVYHVALLPEHWSPFLKNFEFPVITWENLYNQYAPLVPDDYFLEMLRIALDSHSELVSRPSGGNNNEGYMTGAEIYKQYKSAELVMTVMGRQYGLDGIPLEQDIKSGDWQTQAYETSSVTDLSKRNRNWFKIEDFIARIDELEHQ